MIGLISFLAPLILGQAPAVPATEVSLLFAGDAMQHKAQIQSAKQGEAYDYSPCFADITHEIAAADYAVVNLESPIGGQPYTGYPCFSAPDEFPIALQNAGFDLFLTANNHCLDRYTRGAIRTLHILDSIGADHIGTYDSKDSFERFYPFITSIKGIRIAFLNYTYGTNGFTPHSPLIVNYIDEEKIKKDIFRAKTLSADLIVACLHWGDEYQLLPNKRQEDLADFLAKEGVQLIIGAHPHVIQPMELRRTREPLCPHRLFTGEFHLQYENPRYGRRSNGKGCYPTGYHGKNTVTIGTTHTRLYPTTNYTKRKLPGSTCDTRIERASPSASSERIRGKSP